MSLESLVYKISSGGISRRDLMIPTSKSFCNRALVLAAQSSEQKTIKYLSNSTDVTQLIKVFDQMGLKYTLKDQSLTFRNSFPACEKKSSKLIELNSGDGGTTNRFLMAMLALGKNQYLLKADTEMLKRPMEELIEALNALGAHVKQIAEGYLIQGPLKSNTKVVINSKRSSQFYTALKLISQSLQLDVQAIEMENSQAYAKMTDHLVNEIQHHTIITVPVDFSSLGYLIALGVLTTGFNHSQVTSIDDDQADHEIIDILKDVGAQIEISKNGISVGSCSLKPIMGDGRKYPDLIPTLVFLAAHIEGKSTFVGLKGLKHKESNRIAEMLRILDFAGVHYQYDAETYTLSIEGTVEKYRAFEYFAPNDHRMIMMAALFMRKNYGGLIYNAQHVKKSFPNFFEFLAD